MHSVSVVDAKTHFSALLARVEAGEQIAVTRHGKIVARLIPDEPRKGADAFRDFWAAAEEMDVKAPSDAAAEPVPGWD